MATGNIEASPMECNKDPPKDVEMWKLPIEIIKNILLYVDDHSRPNAALVCRTFYELICELDRDKNPLDLLYSEVITLHYCKIQLSCEPCLDFRSMTMTFTNR